VREKVKMGGPVILVVHQRRTKILGGQETSRQPYFPPPPFLPKPRPPLLGSRRRLIYALLPFSPIHYIVIAENLVLGKLPLVNKSPVLLPN